MKTKMISLSKSLLGTALCSLIFMAACQQEMNPQAEQVEKEDLLSNAGKIHNEMISYYYNNRLGGDLSPDEKYAEILDLSWEYLDHNGYDSHYTLETRLFLEDEINMSSLKSVTGDGISIDSESFISQLSETGIYSKHFQKEVKKILSLAHKNDDRKIIKGYVNSTFSGIEFDEDDDTAWQQLFVNIFNASYDFWESMNSSHLKSTYLKLSSWVIINDGIGGVLGSIFGPVGSIVCATALSVATNEGY
ncbi:MAG: hypothetical protein KAR20_03065 [Candidatus Heimdallarchaeota archaeon]|nr:hypothetical protein [Candidatus Heimdallarchaeota archaeon]